MGVDVSDWAVSYGKENFSVDLYIPTQLPFDDTAGMFDVITLWDSSESHPIDFLRVWLGEKTISLENL
ncbi:MAG: hypothetical protein R3E74_15010 [Pseudomonadales bacterium]